MLTLSGLLRSLWEALTGILLYVLQLNDTQKKMKR